MQSALPSTVTALMRWPQSRRGGPEGLRYMPPLVTFVPSFVTFVVVLPRR